MTSMKIYFLLLLSSVFVCKIFGGVGVHWDYEGQGPLTWSKSFPDCAGESQSPINLGYDNVVYKKFPPFVFTRKFNSYLLFNLKNNGHTVVAELVDQKSSNINLQLIGGGLPGTFQFTNFHLHWGASPSEGSEHTINGSYSAGEAHFVFTHVETKQLAVLAFFIAASTTEQQPAWRSYVDNAVTLIREGTQKQFLVNLMLLMETKNNFQDFWRYNGSLTTPPCSEKVIWTVFNSHIEFSNDELHLLSSNVLHKDFRPTQLRNNRTVYHSTLDEATGFVSDQN